MSVKCIVCMDSGYLAVNAKDSNIIIPMLELLGSDLEDYRLQKCSCRRPDKQGEWKEIKKPEHTQMKL